MPGSRNPAVQGASGAERLGSLTCPHDLGDPDSHVQPPQTAPRRTAPANANETRETLAAQPINGLIASGTRVTRTIPAGQIGNAQPIQTVREVWTSSDLKVAVMTKVSDPRTGTVVTQLTNVNRSEPDPTLFQVPADYEIIDSQPVPKH